MTPYTGSRRPFDCNLFKQNKNRTKQFIKITREYIQFYLHITQIIWLLYNKQCIDQSITRLDHHLVPWWINDNDGKVGTIPLNDGPAIVTWSLRRIRSRLWSKSVCGGLEYWHFVMDYPSLLVSKDRKICYYLNTFLWYVADWH